MEVTAADMEVNNTTKWAPPGDPTPEVVTDTEVAVVGDKWVYTKGLLMTIEGARLKAHMIQVLYRKAKESELGGWNISFSNALIREALVSSLHKALPTFDASHRSKFPDVNDDDGIDSFFAKIKANFEKGRLRTYMREGDSNGAVPPIAPEGPEPDLEMTDSKIIYHKTWLQNYAWFVCQWMDRSGRSSSKKRPSTGGVATPSRKRGRQSLGTPSNWTSMPGMLTSNLESGYNGDDAIMDTLQFGFKCVFSMVAAANNASMETMDRMRMVALNLMKEAEETHEGARQERAKEMAKAMSDAINSLQSLY